MIKMSLFKTMLSSALMLCGLLIPGTATLADEQTFGDSFRNYTVHYIAVNSTFLTPEIAEQYGIERSERRAFLNIAVLRNEANGSTTPVTAAITGGKRNLMQQASDLVFTEIREGDAIYYIGEFDFSNAEIVRFMLSVQPEGLGSAHEIEWSTQLYTN